MKRPRLPDPLAPLRRRLAAARAAIQNARQAEAEQRAALDAIAPDWTAHTPDTYTIGANGQTWQTRTLVVRDWMPRVSPSWLAPLLFDLGPDADVTVALHSERYPVDVAARRLRTQRTLQASVAQARIERGAISDPAEQLDLSSAEEIAQAVAAGQECLFAVSLALTLRAASSDVLDALEARVRERLAALSVTLGGTRWQHRAGFLSAAVPYASDLLGRTRTLDTTSLAMCWPFLGSDVPPAAADAPLWGIHLADRSPIQLDLWDESRFPAPHVVIVAPTGAGKTTAALHLLAEHATLPDAPDLVVIDPAKGDYRRMVQALGGQIVRLTARPDVVLNPFDLPPRVTLSGSGAAQEQNPVLEQARLAVGLVALMVCDEGQRLSKADRAVTEAAILAAYRSKGIDPDAPETWNAGPSDVPLLRDVLTQLQQATDAASVSLAQRLAPYCTGTLSGLFDRPTTLRLEKGLTSFDLEGLDSELRPLAIWLISNSVWQRAKSDRRRRILCLDEVKTLLEHPESARLVAHLYSLGRAYRLSVWSMTQLLSDYATAEGQRALDNAHVVLALRQPPGEPAAALCRRYSLSAEDQQFLEAAGRGDGILLLPDGHARLHVSPPPLVLAWASGVSDVTPPAAEMHGQPETNGHNPAGAGVAPHTRGAVPA